MLPLFQHATTRECFVVHYATAADKKRAKLGFERGVTRNKVTVTFAPLKKKPREAAWAEYKKNGTRYH